MKKTRYFLFLAFMLTSHSLFAGSLQQDHVSGDTQWLLHVDFDALRASEFGGLMQDEIQTKHQEKIDALAQLLGSDITTDLFGVTMYGTGAGEENAAVLVYGAYDKDTVQALLVLNKAYSKSEYNGWTIHHWTDEKRQKEQYGAFAADDIIVLAQTENMVINTLNVLADKQSSLAEKSDSTLGILCDERKDTIVLIAGEGLASLAEGNEQAAILKNSKLIAALVAETSGNLKLDIHLEAQDEQTAMQIEQMARGMLAFIMLQAQQNPKANELLQTIALTRDKAVLDCTFTYPSADLFEIIKNEADIQFDVAEKTEN